MSPERLRARSSRATNARHSPRLRPRAETHGSQKSRSPRFVSPSSTSATPHLTNCSHALLARSRVHPIPDGGGASRAERLTHPTGYIPRWAVAFFSAEIETSPSPARTARAPSAATRITSAWSGENSTGTLRITFFPPTVSTFHPPPRHCSRSMARSRSSSETGCAARPLRANTSDMSLVSSHRPPSCALLAKHASATCTPSS
mmetsp:Transcript_8027/g.33542  ORF Transcript_8027/g.33542 Transcript_8027/m.33542 type:complete len:203 (+) Transcript_8027:79-687(+)